MHSTIHNAIEAAPFVIAAWVAVSLPMAVVVGRLLKARETNERPHA